MPANCWCPVHETMVGHLCVVISAIQYTKYKPFDADVFFSLFSYTVRQRLTELNFIWSCTAVKLDDPKMKRVQIWVSDYINIADLAKPHKIASVTQSRSGWPTRVGIYISVSVNICSCTHFSIRFVKINSRFILWRLIILNTSDFSPWRVGRDNFKIQHSDENIGKRQNC